MVKVFEFIMVRMIWGWYWVLHRVFDIKSIQLLAIFSYFGGTPRGPRWARDLANRWLLEDIVGVVLASSFLHVRKF